MSAEPRVLVVDTLYKEAISNFTPGLAQDFTESGLGSGGDYTQAFRSAGAVTYRLVANAISAGDLKAYGKLDHALASRPEAVARIPILGPKMLENSRIAKNLLLAVREIRPNLIYVLNPNIFTRNTLELVRSFDSTVKIFSQISSPLPPGIFMEGYDLVFSILQKNIDRMVEDGIPAQKTSLAFASKQIRPKPFHERKMGATFVGSVGRHHRSSTLPLLRAISETGVDLNIFSPQSLGVFKRAGLGNHYRGTVFGKEMFEVLADSKITINRHARFADNQSLNLRSFEASGMGSALLTERTKASQKVFGTKGALLYRNPQDAANLVSQYLSEPKALESIAIKGHKIVLENHRLETRASEVLKKLAELKS